MVDKNHCIHSSSQGEPRRNENSHDVTDSNRSEKIQSATAARLESQPPTQSLLSQSVSRSLRRSIVTHDGRCARQSIPLKRENVINRFSHDVLTAILVNQNNPRGIELHFYHANNIFCFMKSIWPLVKWVKTICINGFINEN